MKKQYQYSYIIFIFCYVFPFLNANAQSTKTGDDSLLFFKNPRLPIQSSFENLPINAIKPEGWIKKIMQQDISQGFVAVLDQLVPKIINEDIYYTARRKSKTDIPNAGTQVLTGADWEISMQWWGGETQGNWWDGFVRNAYMTNDSAAMSKADNFVNHILASQDDDGYIGIYGKELRYNHDADNGELWSQTTLFRTLLGYYELSGKKNVLEAVIKAMNLTMARYNENTVSPFNVKNDFGGVTHGLIMTDVCETLYRITSNKKYIDFAVYLYGEFSKYPLNRYFNDIRYASLMATDSLFIGHAAHTYEHMRSLLLAYHSTGYTQLKQAYSNALKKLDYCMLPGGAGFGDEFLLGRKANADSSAAEYCAMLELRNFFTSAVQKTSAVEFADKAEKLTFNSMQGARYNDGKGITYCKPDNCIVLNEKSPLSGFTQNDVRYKYSPTHADAAVCCNPNYGRNFPYYVSSMWMKSVEGFVAVLYGPAILTAKYAGVPITIKEETTYPFSDKIDFIITAETETQFSVYLRKPGWSAKATVNAKGAVVKENNGYFIITKKWKTGDKINYTLQNNIEVVQTSTGEITLQRGAIVYALSIPNKEEKIKDYPVAGFKDLLVYAADSSFRNVQLHHSAKKNDYGFIFTADEKNVNPWYEGSTHLTGRIFNTETNTYAEIHLVPMGGTVLRKVTFMVHD